MDEPQQEPAVPVDQASAIVEVVVSAVGIVTTLCLAIIVSQSLGTIDLSPKIATGLGVGALVATAAQVFAYQRIRANKRLFSHPITAFVFDLLQFLGLAYILPFMMLGLMFLWAAVVTAIFGSQFGELGLGLFLLSLAPWLFLAIHVAGAIYQERRPVWLNSDWWRRLAWWSTK